MHRKQNETRFAYHLGISLDSTATGGKLFHLFTCFSSGVDLVLGSRILAVRNFCQTGLYQLFHQLRHTYTHTRTHKQINATFEEIQSSKVVSTLTLTPSLQSSQNPIFCWLISCFCLVYLITFFDALEKNISWGFSSSRPRSDHITYLFLLDRMCEGTISGWNISLFPTILFKIIIYFHWSVCGAKINITLFQESNCHTFVCLWKTAYHRRVVFVSNYWLIDSSVTEFCECICCVYIMIV